MCVCVFFPFILDIKFVGRTGRGHTGGRSHRISHPPSFCGACLNFSREKDSAIPFPRRPYKYINHQARTTKEASTRIISVQMYNIFRRLIVVPDYSSE